MDAVLAAAVDAAKELHLVKSVVAVGIADAIQAIGATSLIDHDVKAVEGIKKAVRSADVEIDRLWLDRTALADRRQCHAIELAILIGDDQAAFRVNAHGDPGAFEVARNGVEQLKLEILGYFDIAG